MPPPGQFVKFLGRPEVLAELASIDAGPGDLALEEEVARMLAHLVDSDANGDRLNLNVEAIW